MNKSSRHSKITGDFGEYLTLYWLSKSGFECARVDHTGIDIIARRPNSKEVMGISVKARSRSKGTERASITLKRDEFKKAAAACKAFRCKLYFAFVVDRGDNTVLYLLPEDVLKKICSLGYGGRYWSMAPAMVELYRQHRKIRWVEFDHKANSWW